MLHDFNFSHHKQTSRRSFLTNAGLGLSSIALTSMLHEEGMRDARAANAVKSKIEANLPHFAPKAKSVIWFFMIGGASHMETFDPKPALTKYGNMSIDETPYKDVLNSPYLEENLRVVVKDDANGKIWPKVFPLQTGYKKRGESGLEISDWFPHLSKCADDLAIVRSMWTTDNNHGAQLQFHTGRHTLDGTFPTIGSWVHYGLGSLNENLPQFVVLGTPLADCCGGQGGHGANYLGPEHDGIHLKVDPHNPLPFATPTSDVYREEQAAEFGLLNKLNRLAAKDYEDDPLISARIKSYELAFRMQTAIPSIMDFSEETPTTQEMYGLNESVTKEFGEQCLAARRLVERGSRFIQIYHGNNGGAGKWDAHGNLKKGHTKLCKETDQPIAGLLTDLKQRGLLDETLVVWGTEFGRTPGTQAGNGRDHHPFGFSVWMAGGGIKGGIAHGKTDELGYHAVENRHYVTDLHATVMHQLGLTPSQLSVPGRVRLEMDLGHPIHEIIA